MLKYIKFLCFVLQVLYVLKIEPNISTPANARCLRLWHDPTFDSMIIFLYKTPLFDNAGITTIFVSPPHTAGIEEVVEQNEYSELT